MSVLLLPIAAAALIVFAVPYWLTAYGARSFTREPDVAATAKVVGGVLIYGAWLLTLTAGAAWMSGLPAALVTALGLPVLAVAGLFALERESAVLDTVRAWLLLTRTNPGTRMRLRRHRSELADLLDEVHAWLTNSEGTRA